MQPEASVFSTIYQQLRHEAEAAPRAPETAPEPETGVMSLAGAGSVEDALNAGNASARRGSGNHMKNTVREQTWRAPRSQKAGRGARGCEDRVAIFAGEDRFAIS